MKIELSVNVLKAAACCAAVKDIRYYLMGVHLAIKNPGIGMVYGTDGHAVFAGQCMYLSEDDCSGLALTIPLDVIKAIPRGSQVVELSKVSDGLWQLGAMVFTPIDGRYPDVSRVIPDKWPTEQTAANFDPSILENATRAMRIYYDRPRQRVFSVFCNGLQASKMLGLDSRAIVIIMPRHPAEKPGDDFSCEYM